MKTKISFNPGLRFVVFYAWIIFLLIYGCQEKEENYHQYPISPIDIKDVVLTDSFWLPKVKIIQDTTIKYAFEKCEEEGRMDNFLIAGGVKEGKTKGKMPFDDTDLYKIIEGASYSLISKPNPILDAYLDSVIAIIKTGQEDDGYLTTWFTIDRQNPPASWVSPSKERWENVISSHELYNSGHLFEAAAAHYWATGKRNLLNIALKNADLLVANFGPNGLHRPPGHQIVETGLIKLYQITKHTDYLELSKFFLDLRGDSATHQLYGGYSQDHIPVIEQTEAVGHAVRAVYMYAAMTDIAAIYKDSSYLDAVMDLWKNVVNKKMYITGGLGSRHEGEAFGENYELPNLTAYSETCAAIGGVYWNHRLFLLTGDARFYDILERTLYNGVIPGLSYDGKKFFYPNPLEADGEYPFNKGACTRQSWFDCSCCPTNLIRFIPSIPGLIYAVNEDSLYINLFMSNYADVSMNNTGVNIAQQTNYPWDGKVIISVNPDKAKRFTLKVRVPGWVQGNPVPGDLYTYKNKGQEKPIVQINGREEKIPVSEGYLTLTREWEKGDIINLDFPMVAYKVMANTKVGEDLNKIAFEYGPLVYCAEEADNGQLSDIVIPDDINLKVEQKSVLSNKINVLISTGQETDLTLIPYYLWSNRGVGEMKVWFAESIEKNVE